MPGVSSLPQSTASVWRRRWRCRSQMCDTTSVGKTTHGPYRVEGDPHPSMQDWKDVHSRYFKVTEHADETRDQTAASMSCRRRSILPRSREHPCDAWRAHSRRNAPRMRLPHTSPTILVRLRIAAPNWVKPCLL